MLTIYRFVLLLFFLLFIGDGFAISCIQKSLSLQLHGNISKEQSIRRDFSQTIKKGKKVLKRELSKRERIGLFRAHRVGLGKKGKDGSPAVLGNYSQQQIILKYKTLRQAGFTKKETKELLRKSVAGYEEFPLDPNRFFSKKYDDYDDYHDYDDYDLEDFDNNLPHEDELDFTGTPFEDNPSPDQLKDLPLYDQVDDFVEGFLSKNDMENIRDSVMSKFSKKYNENDLRKFLVEHPERNGLNQEQFEIIFEDVKNTLTGVDPFGAKLNNTLPRVKKVKLTDQEKSVLGGYTMGDYGELNPGLRSGKLPTGYDPKELIEILNKRLPKMRRNTYRGLHLSEDKIKEMFVKGKSYVNKSFMSTSIRYDIAAEFRYNYLPTSDELPLLLKIKGKSGRYFEPYSESKFEYEVLFSPNTTFIVQSVKKTKTGYYIEIQEK